MTHALALDALTLDAYAVSFWIATAVPAAAPEVR